MIFRQLALIEDYEKYKKTENKLNFFKGNEFNKSLFLKFFKTQKFHRPKVVGEIITNTGRKDLFFYLNPKDETRFITWKYLFDVVYWEDVFNENKQHLYDEEVLKRFGTR